jgi:hypothetical protein
MKNLKFIIALLPVLVWAQAELPKDLDVGTKAELPSNTGAVIMGGPCHEDFKKYCGNEKGDRDAKKKCVKENKDKFSEVCRGHLSEMKEEWKQAHDACEGDMAKYCAEMPEGKGGRLQCLKKNEASLSAECKSSMADIKNKRKAWKKENKKRAKKESNN